MERELTSHWPAALRRYLAFSLGLHLAWEVVQLPLYTLSRTGTLREQAFAVLHCTIGDLMIAGLTLLAAFALVGRARWPAVGARAVWLLTLLLGVGYTIYSEWLNVSVHGSWAYSDADAGTSPHRHRAYSAAAVGRRADAGAVVGDRSAALE